MTFEKKVGIGAAVMLVIAIALLANAFIQLGAIVEKKGLKGVTQEIWCGQEGCNDVKKPEAE